MLALDFLDLSGRSLQVVVVEDHDLLRQELVGFLSRPGINVRGADDGEVLDELLRECAADIVVVDLNLPGEDGLSVCRRLRAAFPDVGLVMLTARVMPSDRTSGYANGADVYLTKPTNVDELDAVVANLARRKFKQVLNYWRLDTTRLRLSKSETEFVTLTHLEVRLMYELTLAAEHKMSLDALQWRMNDFTGRFVNLPVTVSRLRSKLDTVFKGIDAIKAVRGFGYQLTLPVRIE